MKFLLFNFPSFISFDYLESHNFDFSRCCGTLAINITGAGLKFLLQMQFYFAI